MIQRVAAAYRQTPSAAPATLVHAACLHDPAEMHRIGLARPDRDVSWATPLDEACERSYGARMTLARTAALARAITLVIELTLGLWLGSGCGKPEAEALPSVRLGMTPRDVRDRFQPGVEGAWQTRVGSGDDTIIEWSARDPSARVLDARFEFHLGMLVAVRAHLNEPVAKDIVSTTAKTVTLRAPAAGGGSSMTILARDCPTHRDEAESLAARAR